MTSKADLRQERWRALSAAGAARFPGTLGRIPNFVGAEDAARRLLDTEELRGALAASELSGLNLSITELDKLCDGWRAGCPYPFEEFATKITKVPVPVLSLLRSRTGCSPAVVDRGSHFHAC